MKHANHRSRFTWFFSSLVVLSLLPACSQNSSTFEVSSNSQTNCGTSSIQLPDFRLPNAFQGNLQSSTDDLLSAHAKRLAEEAEKVFFSGEQSLATPDQTRALVQSLRSYLSTYATKFSHAPIAQPVDRGNGVLDDLSLASYINNHLPAGYIRNPTDRANILVRLWPTEIAYTQWELSKTFAASEDVNASGFRDFVQTYLAALGNRALNVQKLRAGPAWVYFGFSRCIDRKGRLTPELMASIRQDPSWQDSGQDELFFQTLTQYEETPTMLLPHQKGAVVSLGTLFGSLLSFGRNNRDTTRADISNTMGVSLDNMLVNHDPHQGEALGCAPAYCANLNAAMARGFSDLNRTYFDGGQDPVQPERSTISAVQARKFVDDVRFIGSNIPAGSDPMNGLRKNQIVADVGTKYNFILQASPATYNLAPKNGAAKNFAINNVRAILSPESGMNVPLFNKVWSDAGRLIEVGAGLKLFFLTGLHYLTTPSLIWPGVGATWDSHSVPAIESFRKGVAQLRQRNAALLVHHQYVARKVPTIYPFEGESTEAFQQRQADAAKEPSLNEGKLYLALRGTINSWDLNAVELIPLIRNVAQASSAQPPVDLTKFTRSELLPQEMYPLARWLMDTLELDRLSVHGEAYDCVFKRGAQPEGMAAIVTYLLKSTQVAAHKMQNATGEIKQPNDIQPFYWYAKAENVSVVLSFWKWWEGEVRANAGRWKNWAVDGYYIDGDIGFTMVPTPRYWLDAGGAVSLGDLRAFVPLRMEIAPPIPSNGDGG